MEKDEKNYTQLHNLSREARILGGISSLLDWDQETYMPSGSAGIRAEQLKLLAGLTHAKKTGRPFATALAKLIDLNSGEVLAKALPEAQQAALKIWRRDYLLEKALPKRFVEDFVKLTSQAMHVWRHAREQDAFQQFAPYLEKIVKMSRKKAELIGYKTHPYDALLDHYEPGATTEEITPLFAHLRSAIVDLLKTTPEAQKIDDSLLFGSFPQEEQIKFGKFLLKAMNYDMTKGRLDFSTHPFSSAAHPTDSRITTRIHPTSLISNISIILHEAGHSLYEMGLPEEQYGSPLGESISLGMHESQSRWWETRIGQSKPFWHHFLPLLKQHFPGKLDKITLEQFYRAINKVKPDFIRVEADEVTYSLHVILRFELERALIEGSMKVRDIPKAWNAKMQELLGITPKSNREGCLQDVHWAMGGFGYFPTYTLGNLYASHLFTAFEKQFPDWKNKLESGELGFIKTWLHDSIHQHGRRYSSKELLQKVTGTPFSADAYINYLTTKYTSL